ncbi:MAG: helix-hairpin-helix domain-containing protein [Tannerella sp.]|jgi:DNA uptake protein ComE-like DNA-binding protein|nr:helix-hairpin-helix domain-containing protein [Tannerella sp.]
MSWHDFFYFSKGERQALILLLCLIVIAGILLISNNKPVPADDSVAGRTEYASDGNTQNSADSASPENVVPSVTPPKRSQPANKSVTQNQSEKKSVSGRTAGVAEDKKETVSERVKRITSSSRPSYPRTEKFEKGVVVELNTADTAILKKIPGIGSSYARRIVGYRNLLGGYYSVTQLSEVYGVDEERYNAFVPWFTADTSLISKLRVNELSQDSLQRHPYINYNQAKILIRLRRQKGKLTGWENLQLLNEFMDIDRERLKHYLSFE